MTVIYEKLYYVDESKDDDSGWVTESSACFEDTLFEDSPKKKRRGGSHVKPSNQVAAFVSFGGDVKKVNNRVESMQRPSLTQYGEIQDATGKRKFSSSQSQQSVPVATSSPKSVISESQREISLKIKSRSTSFPITYKGMEAPTGPSVKGNPMGNSAMIGINPVDDSRAALMSPPKRMLTHKVSSRSVLMQSTQIDKSAPKMKTITETASLNLVPPRRKQLSSVGLSALKSKTGSGIGEEQNSRGRKGLAPSRPADATNVKEWQRSAQTSSHPR